MIEHSIFAMEICARLDHGSSFREGLHRLIVNHPALTGHQQKWTMYRHAAELVQAHLDIVEKGCWDYFDNDAKATADFAMWSQGMLTEEGARVAPSGPSDPYRGQPRYMTFTMAFLLLQGSPTDDALKALCDIPEGTLWRRDVFRRLLNGMGVINFASVEADVVYLIPGDDGWGLTTEDLALPKFEYLRALSD